jgi:hypothetical protein
MKALSIVLIVLAGLSPTTAIGSTVPTEDEITLEDLEEAEAAFTARAEAEGYVDLTAFACGIRDDAAVCYATHASGVVRGESAWGVDKAAVTLTDFPIGTAPTGGPVGEAGTRTNPTPIGVVAPVGAGWTAIVNSVNLDATEVVMAANQFNEPPIAGSQYVLANVTVTYNGVEASDTSGVSFEALGPSNVALDAGGSTYATPPMPLELFTEVFQGGSLTGDIVFEVPTTDVDDLVIIGHAFMSFDDEERSFFATTS